MKPDTADEALSPLRCCPRSMVRRGAKKASYDRAQAYQLIDALKTGHLGFVEHGAPRVIPITIWRLGDALYVHCLEGGRLSKRLDEGVTLCISFAVTDEWVMSKSAYHHSANYRSLVLYGTASRVTDDQAFDAAFEAIIEQLEPGRWQQVREPSPKERKITALFRIPIEEGAFKSRTGGPNEEPEDLDLPVWNGVMPAAEPGATQTKSV
ncbi:pyridoxamine 5'-phosphate oxidase family protein [Marinobacter sp. CA1]|uniref:pyridoxamine 5'-phosphate oxidase family protein n=1 Tax=Marinobacter sp. CA1 TaxID=2817656 RepID=UPI001D081975|nr:pyridoxamine 5'-phosphate oxidase family protein [Marinobacter sp. CA1]UDL03600.1 pyridoxamine 5'-phosphate oxidase family protein [Marinobacter sp. CA1]